MSLAEELRSWRLALGWSRKQAAEFLGVPLRTLEAWEQGRQQPDQPGPLRTIMRLMAAEGERSEDPEDNAPAEYH